MNVHDDRNVDRYTASLREAGILGDVLVEFAAADTAEKKFMVTHDALLDCLKPARAPYSGLHIPSPISSENIRLQGNTFFKSKRFHSAIVAYTSSIMHSQPGLESWTFALANRSAALYRIDDYSNCLKDIDRALEASYPDALAYKLYRRAGRAECLLGRCDAAKRNYAECLKHVDMASISEKEKIRVRVEMAESIKQCGNTCAGSRRVEPMLEEKITSDEVLAGGPNESIPALSKFLELKYTESMGRGVYATCDINPGSKCYYGSFYATLVYSFPLLVSNNTR